MSLLCYSFIRLGHKGTVATVFLYSFITSFSRAAVSYLHIVLLCAEFNLASYNFHLTLAHVFVPEAQDMELIFTPSWPVIFQRAFMNTAIADPSNGPRDDLLFFVFKGLGTRSKVSS